MRATAGEWEAGGTGVYTIHYIATEAGPCRLHVWCDPQSKGERLPFPNSPFQLLVSSGEPSNAVSLVDGWTKQLKDEKVIATMIATPPWLPPWPLSVAHDCTTIAHDCP